MPDEKCQTQGGKVHTKDLSRKNICPQRPQESDWSSAFLAWTGRANKHSSGTGQDAWLPLMQELKNGIKPRQQFLEPVSAGREAAEGCHVEEPVVSKRSQI